MNGMKSCAGLGSCVIVLISWRVISTHDKCDIYRDLVLGDFWRSAISRRHFGGGSYRTHLGSHIHTITAHVVCASARSRCERTRRTLAAAQPSSPHAAVAGAPARIRHSRTRASRATLEQRAGVRGAPARGVPAHGAGARGAPYIACQRAPRARAAHIRVTRARAAHG